MQCANVYSVNSCNIYTSAHTRGRAACSVCENSWFPLRINKTPFLRFQPPSLFMPPKVKQETQCAEIRARSIMYLRFKNTDKNLTIYLYVCRYYRYIKYLRFYWRRSIWPKNGPGRYNSASIYITIPYIFGKNVASTLLRAPVHPPRPSIIILCYYIL